MTSDGKIETGDVVSSSLFIKAMNAFYNKFKATINLPKTHEGASAWCGKKRTGDWNGTIGGITYYGRDVLTIPLEWYRPIDTAVLVKPSGRIEISVLYRNLSVILDCFLYVRYIHATWYHSHLDSYWLISEKSGYQNINKDPIAKPVVTESIKRGDLIKADDFNTKLNEVYNSWLTSISNAGTIESQTFTCHYACHYDHTNRVRR